METWLQLALASVVSILASSGFWAYVQRKNERGDATTRLLMGLAYAQLMTLGLDYLGRGTITKDEYEDYRKYFFEPYKALGGNGVAEHMMSRVSRLPFRSHFEYTEIYHNQEDERFINNVRIVTRFDQDASAE